MTDRFNPVDLADLIETENEGATGLMGDLIRDFSSQCENAIAEMDKAQAAKQYRDLERMAHSLKSSSRLLGLRATANICEEIEDKAHEQGFSPDAWKVLRDELIPALEELKSFEASRKPGGSH